MKKPHEGSALADFVSRRVLELRVRRTQAEIAAMAGFPNPNMVTMIKNGASKLALDRVPSMARALDCDPAYLLRLALQQSEGDQAALAIIEIFGMPVTMNERGWIEVLRDASGHSDPRITTRSQAAIRAIFGR